MIFKHYLYLVCVIKIYNQGVCEQAPPTVLMHLRELLSSSYVDEINIHR
jgi:hypothetical protein